jgi:23S rRNA pseudouridine1911/1915/1917 synthase
MNSSHSFTADSSGLRLDKFVVEKIPTLSRTRIQELIGAGAVTVNGKTAKASLKLEAGDRIEVNVLPEAPTTLEGEDIPLNIVYEDADLLVIDKPAGLAVHPAPGNPSGTLANAVVNYLPSIAKDAADLAVGETNRPGIVHRLDKDTSGLIIVAKNRAAQANLAEQFQNRTVKKTYITLVKGRLTPEQGAIEADIGRDPKHRQKMAVVADGREARTGYKVIRYYGNNTLLEIHPETGRTHQIRVHLAAIGYPVAGDATYGLYEKHLKRQFLHAGKIEFSLPSSGARVEFSSPLPEDLQKVLADLG